ncbi:glyoxalase/bleomycin resistance/extradiol dioxygenase family protein [Chryseobacterium capnotolerans]|uniref:glyoxalase superfamily protein n=1 Tax=Chryseobacterium TaxID=59732 RepID=UPI00083B7DFC|nr:MULTISPECIES: glyoxalase/bleomycin resistance/extradiol dioxygenase family protein [Chryseobacterium]UHO39813.1 glyoxalase/bleomycin resistance/extradiol dioxygenase family protein [Chryseobacterium capnotolerans]
MKADQIIPVLRIFDYQKALEFYVDWLGFEIAWEHRFEENMPAYIEVKKENIIIHLTEHHGDASPGSSIFIWGEGVAEYHKELIDKNYKYNRPGLEKTFYDAVSFTVNDPFGNKIIFNEKYDEKKHGDLKFHSIE